MKIRLLLCSLFLSLVTVSGVRAADQKGHDGEEQTELGEHMEKIGGAYRRLGRQVADAAQNENSLALLETIHTHAVAASKLTPAKAADLPEADRAAFVTKYQEGMKHFIGDVEKTQTALKAGNNAEAVELVKAQLKADQKKGHDDFQKKKDKK